MRTDSISEARRLLADVMGCTDIRLLRDDAECDVEIRHIEFEKSHLFELHVFCDIEIDIQCRRHLICFAQEGAVTYRHDGESLTMEGTDGAILAPPSCGPLLCSAGSSLIGIMIAEGDFRREASTVLQGSSPARLGATRKVDLSHNSGRVFLDTLHMVQADLDSAQACRNNRSIRLMFDRLIVYSLLHLVGGEALEQTVGGRSGLAPRHIKRAEEYIKAHMAEPLDNDLLAKVAQVSPRSLYRGFIHFRGMTPARYVQELRLDQAHRLLTAENRQSDIRTIAEQSGFRSYASFWRSYVRKFGAPPSKSRPPKGFTGEDNSRS
ncbi:MAG TPA: helix-turn-helix domain-containing protein [Rhodopila sp.]|jgi:AraC-like DNA-binding protein